MKLLLLGGSGQLSGRLARLALEQGHDVWTVTRGLRPLPEGVHGVTADRNDPDMLRRALDACHMHWDAALDTTCRTPEHARIDLDVLPGYTGRLVVVSTDSVYHPDHKTVPQTEDAPQYMDDGGYGAQKRQMEQLFQASSVLDWTIFRPGHIFGPGFLPGCYPEQSRQPELLQLIRDGQPMRLVGGGEYLIHPIFVDDMALAMLDCIEKSSTINEIFCIGGPDIVTNAAYYHILGDLLGCAVTIEVIPEEGYLDAHPTFSGHLCHRAYDLGKLQRAGVRMPDMPLKEGLRLQVEWLDAQERQ